MREDGIKNLQIILDVLKEVPDEQFNMEHWWLDDGEAFDDERNVMYKVADGPCGCVIGHLIQRGILQGSIIEPDMDGAPPPEHGDRYLPYEYRDRIFSQISHALKIYNHKIAEYLFDQYSYIQRPITKNDVINRINFTISEMAVVRV